MGINKRSFGSTPDGTEIFLYTLENSRGMKAEVMNYGAILVNLLVPDQDGITEDVVLGYDKLEDYYENKPNLGATIGPNANRIGGACFTLEGVRYELDANDGPNNLHSHAMKGYHKRVWEVTEGDASISFYLEQADGDLGFPGNKKITVTYTLTEENELKIHYHGESDKNTVINLTNHTYFNLNGHKAGEITDHILTLEASAYTPVVEGAIPTGEIAQVKGTPMDFTSPRRIGADIDADFEQLKLTGGYDHNWVLDGEAGTLRQFAAVTDADGKRTMKAYTDLPGVQFYAGNFITRHPGKEGATYDFRHGFCLETQYYPNTINEPSFPSAVFGPDRAFDSTTVYRFE